MTSFTSTVDRSTIVAPWVDDDRADTVAESPLGPGLPRERPTRERRGAAHALRSARAWLGLHARSIAILSPALVLVGLVHGIGMDAYPAPVDDEGTYMAQAWAVQFHHTLAPYTYWFDHPPLGWIQIAGWTFLTDGFRGSIMAVAAGRHFMLLAFLVSCVLVYVIARRLGLNRGWSTVAVLVLGLSPLSVSYERMVYLDNIAVPWMLAAFALALTPDRRLWAFAGSGACYAAAVLSKETQTTGNSDATCAFTRKLQSGECTRI